MELKNLDFFFEDASLKTSLIFKKSVKPAESKFLFKNLNLKINAGEITTLLGPSGSGKSTLLRLFSGLTSPQKTEPTSLVKVLKPESFVFQEANLLEWKTGYQNIMLPIEISHQKLDVNHFEQIVQMLKIKDVLQLYPHQLSGGQKMRVSIARALVTKPEILFMDEPFSALDEPTRLDLQDELLQIQARLKMTILFVTHSFYEAVFLADRIVIIAGQNPSRIIFDESVTKKSQSRFEEEYQKQVQKISEVFRKGLK